ncbi:MAG: electron transport complex subunit RsxC [Bacillota bacterium]|nr:electron transport complex subunit RsxC [Bacillota bacterium]
MKIFRFKGGIHPPHSKSATEKLPIEDFPTPDFVSIPLRQHIGAPTELVVAKGDEVKVGQLLAKGGGFVSANIHSSVSGKVKEIKVTDTAYGLEKVVVIENDRLYTVSETVVPPADYKTLGTKEIVGLIQEAGLVGMGGAGFPTHVKLSVPPDKHVDTIILNGVECEPYITCDHRLMLESPEKIVQGLRIVMHALGVVNGIIGIEDNKPDAIAVMEEAVKGSNITVATLKAKYPQGAEKQLIFATTGREVPSGGLPADAGVVVVNVATSYAIAELFETGMPPVQRCCTITGKGVKNPKNLRFRIGVTLRDMIEYCGGYSGDIGKVILGGPMMGVAQFTDQVQAIKNTSAVLVLTPDQVAVDKNNNCIKCGKCIEVCPIGLQPVQLSAHSMRNQFAEAEKYRALDCIECGSCSFICPAKRSLLPSIRVAKREILAARRKNGK